MRTGNINEPTRRVVLGGVAVVGAGALLSACGGSDAPSGGAVTADPGTTSDSGSGSGGGSGASAVAKTSDVPVGSGIIVASAKAVITQPTAGDFKAFNYLCTHKACPVTKISGDTITCTCHGSEFSAKDGSVVKGPASSPLEELSVTNDGGSLVLG